MLTKTGRGDDGQLGTGALYDESSPKSVPTLRGKDVAIVACGWSHSCAAVCEALDSHIQADATQPMPRLEFCTLGMVHY